MTGLGKMALGRWPITLKAPALVAVLMIAVGVVASQGVLSRLVALQERQLHGLAEAYLDGLSSSLAPHLLRDDVWEVYDTLDRARALYGALRPVDTFVTDRAGLVVAAADPIRIPSAKPAPPEFAARLGQATIAIDDGAGLAYVRRALTYDGAPLGAVYAVLDIDHLLSERASATRTLLWTNAALTLALAAIGYAVVRRLVAPVRVVTDHLARGAAGRFEPIDAAVSPPEGSEARRLFEAYNRLAAAERERRALEARLAAEEKYASLGRLTTGLAHEINNPLGGLFAALDTLRAHGASASVRGSSVALIERGLVGIRDVVAATLHVYRPDRAPRPFGPSDVDDVRLLVRPVVERRRIAIDWRCALHEAAAAPSAPVRQMLLNLVLNACAASAPGGHVGVEIGEAEGEAGGGARGLVLTVSDSGPGLPPEARRILETPGCAAPIGDGGGLGLWMVRRTITELGGAIACDASGAGGARVRVALPASAIGAAAASAAEARA